MEYDRRHDLDKFNHVWLGEYQSHSQSRVFKHVRVEHFETPPTVTHYYGADWGFSNDPSTLVSLFIDHDQGRIYIDHEAYQVGCEIDDLPTLWDNLDPNHPYVARKAHIRADSNRPDTISYMRRHGYPNVTRATKGPNSIHDGIEFLKSYEIVIHPRCIHTAKEFQYYSYEVDELTQQVTSKLSQKKNHVIDAARYAVEAVRRAIPVGAARRFKRAV